MPVEKKITTTKIKEPTMPAKTISSVALQIAASQLGCEEIPRNSNWGKHVEKYLKSVGITFAAPWCMSFAYWCVNEACKELGVTNPLVKTGGVMRQWNEIPAKYKSKTPTKGAIFIMDFGKGLGHTGFVTGFNDKVINTIEGNSNDEGSREGVEVCRKPGGRALTTIKGYINLDA